MQPWLHLVFPALTLGLKSNVYVSLIAGGVRESQLGDTSFLGPGEMEGKTVAVRNQRGLN